MRSLNTNMLAVLPTRGLVAMLLTVLLTVTLLGVWFRSISSQPATALAPSQPRESEEARVLTQELSRPTFLPKYRGANHINLDVLYATPTYFQMAVGEEGAARYAPEMFYVFLISETIHEGDLSKSPPPATLRVDGHEITATEVKVLVDSTHHRTSVVRFPRAEGEMHHQQSQQVELLIADAEPVRWELPITYLEGVRLPAPRLSWTLLLPALAGILAALGPCLIQLVVYYIATLTGVGMEMIKGEGVWVATRWRILRTAIFFSLGFTLVYTAGGTMAGMIGQSLQSLGVLETWNRPLSMAAGAVMLLLGWRVAVNARAPLVCRLPLVARLRSAGGTGLWGSLMTGFAFAFGCLSCFGAAVLSVLLLYVGASGSVLQGTLIMLIFSLGVTVPFLLAALGVGRVVPWLSRFERMTPWLGLASGIVMIGFGLLMLTYRFHLVSSLIYRWFLA